MLSPGVKPREPAAQVVTLSRAEPSPATMRSEVFASTAGEVIYGGQRIVRHGVGQVLGVR